MSAGSVPFLKQCQKELATFYEQQMGTIQLLPWGHDVIDMDTIFVDLTLAVDEKIGGAGKVLQSPEDLLRLTGRNKQRFQRVLVTGFAGSGKSTTLAKLAYDWAKQIHDANSSNSSSILSNVKLLFILSLREFDMKKTLIDAIYDQILPLDTAVDRQELKAYLESHGKDVAVLFDGLDEGSFAAISNKVVDDAECILAGRKMRETCVVVTSRPYKVESLGDHEKQYVHVRLTGFSEDNIEVYIKKFFHDDHEAAESLSEEIRKSPSVKSLAQIPVMLLMLCLLWDDAQRLPDTFTALYEQVILYLWRRYQKAQSSMRSDTGVQEVLLALGKVALGGVSEGKVVFLESEFPNQVLKEACQIGLLTKERLRSRLNIETAVSFLHKSIQEYMAAYYWVALVEKDQEKFKCFLNQVNHDEHIFEQVELLNFCCGMSKIAASLIIPHVVQLLQHRTEEFLRVGGITSTTKNDIWPLFRMLRESRLEYECVHEWLEPLFQSKVIQIRQNPPLSLANFHHLVKLAIDSKMESVLSSVSELKLNLVSEGDIILLAETLRETPHVESLMMSWEAAKSTTPPSQSKMDMLSDSIGKMSQVKNISVFANSKLDISRLVSQLAKGTSCGLRNLEFGNVDFDTKMMGHFLVRQIALKSFSLTNTTLTSQGASDVLSQLNPSVQHVHLVSSHIGDAVQHLQPLMSSLQELVLRATDLEENHSNLLVDFLSKAEKLKHLDLSWNNVGASIVKLASQFHHCPCLETLCLMYCNLSHEGALALTRSFQYLPELMNLSLSFGFGAKGFNNPYNNGFEIVEAMLRALPLIPKLTSLHIKGLKIPETGAPSDIVSVCLSAVDFYWPAIFQHQGEKYAYFVIIFGPTNLRKLKAAVDQYVEKERC